MTKYLIKDKTVRAKANGTYVIMADGEPTQTIKPSQIKTWDGSMHNADGSVDFFHCNVEE